MKSIKVAIKQKTKLLKKLEEQFDITYHKKLSFLNKLVSKESPDIDLYFFNGTVNKEVEYLIKNSKYIICNSVGQKKYIKEKVKGIEDQRLKVIYPYPVVKYEYNNTVQEDFKKQYGIDPGNKIIFFTANDLLKSGVKSFFKTISSLEQKNFEVVVESNKKQIEQLKILLNRQKLDFKIHYIEDYPDKDILFLVSDIYIASTIQKPFLNNILKAIYYKTAVFIPKTNFASELLDPFAVMSKPDDPATAFKVDALLANEEELELVKQTNKERSKDFSFERRFNLVRSLAESLN
jgi:hypothetical protein